MEKDPENIDLLIGEDPIVILEKGLKAAERLMNPKHTLKITVLSIKESQWEE